MDVKEADGSYDKDSDKLRCAIKNNLPGLSKDLRKQYSSILERYEPVFITDKSAVQRKLDHRDELTEAILNSHIEADIIRELANIHVSSMEWKVMVLRRQNIDMVGIGLVLINLTG